ncbi:MAG: DUF3037 domain-containing protein [Tunicatimonas sp.]
MPDKHWFEYAVIRWVPRVEREEFLNVGVIVYCAAQQFLRVKYELDEHRLRAFSAATELEDVRANLLALQRISAGDQKSGPIAFLDTASRFRWLTAVRSTVVQTSPVHPGLCTDAQVTLEELFDRLVR